jgi:hypothetical protein
VDHDVGALDQRIERGRIGDRPLDHAASGRGQRARRSRQAGDLPPPETLEQVAAHEPGRAGDGDVAHGIGRS